MCAPANSALIAVVSVLPRLVLVLFAANGCLFADPGPPGLDSQSDAGTASGMPTSDGPGTSGPGTGEPTTMAPTTVEPTTGEPVELCGWESRMPAIMPPGRIDATLVLVEDYDIVAMYGGRAGLVGQDFDDLWVFDGGNWTRVQTEGSPGPRRGHAAAYDHAHKQLVVHGGERGLTPMFADGTWVLEQTKWSDRGGAAPSPRAYAAMVDMPAQQRVVLFGGRTKDGPSGETWLWDGKKWSDEEIEDGPSPRFDHAMAYDEASGRVLLHGGCTDMLCAAPLTDTWAFDGEDWTKVGGGESPGPRSPGMAYDRSEPAMLRFGEGQGYRWDNGGWPTAGPAPKARSGFVVAYHPGSQGVVLFGGLNEAALESNETWVFRCMR